MAIRNLGADTSLWKAVAVGVIALALAACAGMAETPSRNPVQAGTLSDPKPEAPSETDPESHGLRLIAAVERGDPRAVRELLEAGAYVPGSPDGMRAYRMSQQGNAEVTRLMQAAFDEWWESGAFYDSLMSALTKIRESALESGSYRRWLAETMVKRIWKSFFEGLEGEARELYEPMMARYDEAEFDRRLKAELDALDAELSARNPEDS